MSAPYVQSCLKQLVGFLAVRSGTRKCCTIDYQNNAGNLRYEKSNGLQNEFLCRHY